VQAQRDILEVLETAVSNGELVLKYKNNIRVGSHARVTVTIVSPEINSVTVSGSGNFKTTGNVQSQNFTMNISGSGNIDMAVLNATMLDARVSGSGDIRMNSGTINQETLRISGSGSINTMNITSKNINTTTSGSGSMRVHATETLHATISGSGAVYYKGNPVVSTNISGSGRVVPL
jgi:hypothetical protein